MQGPVHQCQQMCTDRLIILSRDIHLYQCPMAKTVAPAVWSGPADCRACNQGPIIGFVMMCRASALLHATGRRERFFSRTSAAMGSTKTMRRAVAAAVPMLAAVLLALASSSFAARAPQRLESSSPGGVHAWAQLPMDPLASLGVVKLPFHQARVA